ncbi:MAG: 4-hydroxy-tetrahydrodipicolinate reductase [Alistipes sp.]|nr:4-hydroxy-tetrahydrodipicolinate reductase [Alistipes sp.]
MKVVIIGYGKMGREIERLLTTRGHEIVLVIDEDNRGELNEGRLRECGAEVAVEFTTPETAYGNITTCLEAGVGVVSGTTGWLDMLPEVERLCREKGGAFFYASNYSVGVNIFFRVNEALARMMEPFGAYDVTVEEVHHTQKKDAPSGTAITVAEGILAALTRKDRWVGRTTTEPDELEVLAVRRSVVPGTHTVTYESPDDSITITHTAKGRTGFATGAVLAAEFICGRTGIYTMEDMLGF